MGLTLLSQQTSGELVFDPFHFQRNQALPWELSEPRYVWYRNRVPYWLCVLDGGVAQLVEQRTHKPRVTRSIRVTATNLSGPINSVPYSLHRWRIAHFFIRLTNFIKPVEPLVLLSSDA